MNNLKKLLLIVLWVQGYLINVCPYEFKSSQEKIECDGLNEKGKRILELIAEIENELGITVIITSGNRTWEEQLEIMLSRPNSYKITERFRREFDLESVPAQLSQLSAEQLDWWESEILKRANTYFKHVGGQAVDIRVFQYNLSIKIDLKNCFEEKGIQVVPENPPLYNTDVQSATVFHLFMS